MDSRRYQLELSSWILNLLSSTNKDTQSAAFLRLTSLGAVRKPAGIQDGLGGKELDHYKIRFVRESRRSVSHLVPISLGALDVSRKFALLCKDLPVTSFHDVTVVLDQSDSSTKAGRRAIETSAS